MNTKVNIVIAGCQSAMRWWSRPLAYIAFAALAIAPTSAGAQELLKVSEKEARQAALSKPEPGYPPIAAQLKISGKVTIELLIGTDGSVEGCEPVVGNPVLTGAAIRAVKTWTFKPFASAGRRSKAVARLSFEFAQ
jgi:TonB family protein